MLDRDKEAFSHWINSESLRRLHIFMSEGAYGFSIRAWNAALEWVRNNPEDSAYLNDVERLSRQLAESQAREAKLRYAVKRSLHNGSNTLLHEVVKLPSDEAELNKLLAKTAADEREKCAKLCESQRFMSLTAGHVYTGDELIRSLKDTVKNLAHMIRINRG